MFATTFGPRLRKPRVTVSHTVVIGPRDGPVRELRSPLRRRGLGPQTLPRVTSGLAGQGASGQLIIFAVSMSHIPTARATPTSIGSEVKRILFLNLGKDSANKHPPK